MIYRVLTFVRGGAQGQAAQAGAQVVGTRRGWHRGGFIAWQAGLNHGLQAVDKQLRGLTHHVVLQYVLIIKRCSTEYSKEPTLVKGPANRHSPPKPQLWRKWSCCWEGSSLASMFCIMLWTELSTT